MLRPLSFAATIAVALLSTGITRAQQLVYDPVLTLPIVAETQSYSSVIYIHNPGINSISATFSYQGGTTSATPGLTNCPSVDLAAGSVLKTSLASLCPTLNPGGNFGVLVSSYYFGYPIAVYSRVQTPVGIGFSIEGMVDTCCGTMKDVIGLKRQAAFPGYQSNCFIYNEFDRPGRVVVTLASGEAQLIASEIVELQPNEFVRLLDVFAALNAPPGDYDNVRASFESIGPVGGGSTVQFIASCTVQNNTSFDADFRIAKWHY